jgi:hypothetical protein
MTAALTTIGPRLSQFIRLLGSDRDGEVVAAARAIQRTLATVGQDFHDLADIVERSIERSARPPDQEPAHHRECDDWRAMARWVRDSGARLSPKERGFVSDIAVRFGTLSERQAAWLLAIYERTSSERRQRA